MRVRAGRICLAVGLAGLPLAACNVIAGLDKYNEGDVCAADCAVDSRGGDVPDQRVPGDHWSPDVGEDESPAPPDGGVNRYWARWLMPNPRGAEVDANVAQYNQQSGIVMDLVTKLKWQKPPSIPDSDSASAPDMPSAKKICEDMGWRLPTRIELVTLIDYTRLPAIDPSLASLLTDKSVYWTASPYVSTDGALQDSDTIPYWTIDFWSGVVAPSFDAEPKGVLCVQGGA